METIKLKDALQWRYATKRMTGEKIPKEDLGIILESIRLAPTSRGLQPFKIIIIEDPDLKLKIRAVADNQPQVTECSHLLVFAAWKQVTKEQIEKFIQYAADERAIPVEKLDKMKGVLLKDQLTMSKEEFFHWACKQAYIALGFALTSAAILKVDAAAMEGFSPSELDEILGLEKQNLRSAVLLALGYRNTEEDWLLNLKKVRRSTHELFTLMDGKKS